MRHRITTKGGRTLRTSKPERFLPLKGEKEAKPQAVAMAAPAETKSSKKEKKDVRDYKKSP